MTSRIDVAPLSSMATRSSPSARPPCGGAPNDKRVEQESELRARLAFADAEQGKDARLQVRPMDTNAAAAELGPVEHDVVGQRPHARADPIRAGLESSSCGAVNGWLTETYRLSSGEYSTSGKSVTQTKA